MTTRLLLLACLAWSGAVGASTLEQCLAERLKTAGDEVTVGQLRRQCQSQLAAPALEQASVQAVQQAPAPSRATQRLQQEKSLDWQRFALTAHKQNYILPYTYAKEQNAIYSRSGDQELADHQEAKFQISFKVPVAPQNLLAEGDSLHFGLTMKSLWQVYNDELSAPFRETNYQPELFYSLPLNWHPNGADTLLRLGAEHESNGRTQLLSRSWNRVYLQGFYAKDNYLLSLRPWYRLPEDEKDAPLDPDGDDNPDIDDYMGYFEATGVVAIDQLEFSAMLRNNLRGDNKGAAELGLSFPLWGRVKGYAQYFNGYGESLIDYDHRIERIGVGVLITDML